MVRWRGPIPTGLTGFPTVDIFTFTARARSAASSTFVASIWSTMGEGSAPSVDLEPQSRSRSHGVAIREGIREAIRDHHLT
jgi:hypothetical protein